MINFIVKNIFSKVKFGGRLTRCVFILIKAREKKKFNAFD